ncbi:hypothetical protein GC177_00535 [bacterium]|nr:hypothetical protein [bacterium]
MKVLKDIGIIFLSCFVYSYLSNHIVHRAPYDKILLDIFYALYFSSICSAVFIISIRRFQSKQLFVFLSFAAMAVLFYFNLIGAEKISLHERVFGKAIFIDGNVTPFGSLYILIDPVGIMTVLSVCYWLCPHILKACRIGESK